MMDYYLGVSAAFSETSLALWDKNFELIEQYNEQLTRFQKSLLINIDQLLEKYSIEISHIKGIVINVGPASSFTGIRLSVAIIKSFAMVYDIPVYMTSSHELIYYQYQNQLLNSKIYAVILDGKQQRGFVQLFQDNQAINEILDIRYEQLVSYLKDTVSSSFQILGNIPLEYLKAEDKDYIQQNLLFNNLEPFIYYFQFSNKSPDFWFNVHPQYYRKILAQEKHQ